MCEGGSDSSPSLIGNPLTTCTTVVDSDALIVRCPCGYNEVYYILFKMIFPYFIFICSLLPPSFNPSSLPLFLFVSPFSRMKV